MLTTLFIHCMQSCLICLFNSSAYSTHMFVQIICLFNSSVCSTHLFVQFICLFKSSVWNKMTNKLTPTQNLVNLSICEQYWLKEQDNTIWMNTINISIYLLFRNQDTSLPHSRSCYRCQIKNMTEQIVYVNNCGEYNTYILHNEGCKRFHFHPSLDEGWKRFHYCPENWPN